MEYVALYYPSFIPPEQWLKDNLLLWDRLGSIIPYRLRQVADTDDLDFLSSNGLYGQFDPEPQLSQAAFAEPLEAEFADRIDTPDFRAQLVDNYSAVDVSLGKATGGLVGILRDRGWVIREEFEWIKVPAPVGHLYISLLAKHLAGASSEGFVLPGTDHFASESATYGGTGANLEVGMRLQLEKVFPRVNPSASLYDVVRFRQEHGSQLVSYRNFVMTATKGLRDATTQAELTEAAASLTDQLRVKDDEFQRLMGSLKDQTSKGSLSLLFELGAPAVVATGLGLVAAGATGGIAGAIGGAAWSLAKFSLDAKERNRQREGHPLSFVYFGQQEGVIL